MNVRKSRITEQGRGTGEAWFAPTATECEVVGLPEREATGGAVYPWKNSASTLKANRKRYVINGLKANAQAATSARRPSNAGFSVIGGVTCGHVGSNTCKANASGSNSTAATLASSNDTS